MAASGGGYANEAAAAARRPPARGLEECPLPEWWRRPRGKRTDSCCPRWTHYPNNESLPRTGFSFLLNTRSRRCLSREHIKQRTRERKVDERNVFFPDALVPFGLKMAEYFFFSSTRLIAVCSLLNSTTMVNVKTRAPG